LEGNAWRDLAGRRLEFVNPKPVPGDVSVLRTRQTGVIGDCTASRKVKVPELSKEEFAEYYKARKPFPWHWANSLYLEWFSEANGRVVIESADFQLTVTHGPEWEMTEAEEAEQLRANAAALTDFMRRLAPLDDAQISVSDLSYEGDRTGVAEEDNDGTSEAEEAAERDYAENERLLDRVEARLEREGDNADFDAIMLEELNRMRPERGEPPLEDDPTDFVEGDSDDSADLEEAAQERLSRRKHPLAAKAFDFVLWLRDQITPADGAPPDLPHEHPLNELQRCSMIAAAKLAGALGRWPVPDVCRAGSLVRIKRAREYLTDARAALYDCPAALLPVPESLQEIGQRLDDLIAECDRLIAELRRGLE
jgi:hypothetical protein